MILDKTLIILLAHFASGHRPHTLSVKDNMIRNGKGMGQASCAPQRTCFYKYIEMTKINGISYLTKKYHTLEADSHAVILNRYTAQL